MNKQRDKFTFEDVLTVVGILLLSIGLTISMLSKSWTPSHGLGSFLAALGVFFLIGAYIEKQSKQGETT